MKTVNNYLYPVKLTENVKIISHKLQKRHGKLRHAIDFIVPKGTLIKAALDGIVVDVKQDSKIGGPTPGFDKYGNYIEIRHRNGEYSIYEHISRNTSLVKVGGKVKTGQPIGLSGATGWIAHLGPHLHFDVHEYFGNGPEDYKTLEIRWKKF